MKGTSVALGTFDGVHPGHAAILARAVEAARKDGLDPLVYTFSHHPMAAFGKQPPLLMTDEARLEALGAFCAVAADDFTPQFAAMEPRAFLEMLVFRFHMRRAVAGYNYTFGKNGTGDTALLSALGRELGFAVDVVQPVLFLGEPLSSTRIRAALEAGEVALAAKMLQRPYALAGTVAPNKGIGRSIGFPTANLTDIEGLVLPKDGVYATRAAVCGKTYAGVTNVGSNPTVGGEKTTVETHLIGFSGDIYGETLRIEFVERLRGEMKFDGLEALRARIALDAAKAAELLKIQ
ncbi:MAG TPA: bifunctional riboflavin kinase/FAD synthetase [Clostridia bacterium]|nr:bifunctional riboflavin kinase/FAD synthetase [Clostridia bacterium]